MSFRNNVDALTARHDALAAELAAKTKELDAARQLLDEAKERLREPVLPNIRVATPCSADWNGMVGDDRVRACAACNKNVYNLSAMTRDEAEALIIEKEGKLCVRYFQRKDGTILLKDCEVGVSQKRKRRVVAIGASLLLAGGGVIAYKLTRPKLDRVVDDHHAIAGGLELPPPPPPKIEMPAEPTMGVPEIKGEISIERPRPKMGRVQIKH